MRAREPDGRTRGPGKSDRRPANSAPAPPALHLDSARLVQLNRLAGNAAVSSLVGPVVQRVSLSKADESQLETLKKTGKDLAKTAKKRIEKFDAEQGSQWNFATRFAPSSKIPDWARDEFLGKLYRALGQDVALDKLLDLRTTLDLQWGEALGGRREEKRAPGNVLPPRGRIPVPSLDQITSTLGGLKSTTKEVAPSAPPRPARLGLPKQKQRGPQKAPEPAAERPSAAWNGFPPNVRLELMKMWDEWQKGELKTNDFYEKFYKKSEVKPLKDAPSPDEYVATLKEQDLLGGNSEANAKSFPNGYPLMLENKSGTPKSRIYLNPHPQHTVKVYRFVNDHIQPMKGVIWTKLADHKTAMTVRDVIVIYLDAGDDHARTESEALRLLADYQSANPRHFIDEVPRLTNRRLPGVGVGAEPPAFTGLFHQYVNSMSDKEQNELEGEPFGFSFSTYRSALVVQAIEDAGGVGGSVERYRSLVADYFARAGIDPSDPAGQKPPDMSIIPLLGMVRKKTKEDA